MICSSAARSRIKICFVSVIMAALLANIVGLVSRLLTSHSQRSVLSHQSRTSKYKLPYPETPHLVLNEDAIRGRKVLIVGDVHGCLHEMEELLQEAKSKFPDQEILPIFVGDLLSKGPFPVETLKKLQKIEHYAVRGNHDEAVLRQALSLKKEELYQLPPKYSWVPNLSDDIGYLRELPYTISIPSLSVIIVHAGLVPGIPLTEQELTNMIIMRNLVKSPEGTLSAAELTNEGEAWASFWPGPDHVYFGHDARRKLQKHAHATGLDTGCVYGNHLTGAVVTLDSTELITGAVVTKDSTELIQVKAKQVYKET